MIEIFLKPKRKLKTTFQKLLYHYDMIMTGRPALSSPLRFTRKS